MSSYQSGGGPSTTTTTHITPLIWFDKNYVHSNEGLGKIVVIIIDLAAFIISQFAPSSGKTGFFGFTSMSAFWISLALFGLYAFHVVEKLYNFQWLLTEFAFSLIWGMFFFVASLLLLISGGVQTLAAIFGFLAFGIYAYEARRNYLRYSNGEIPQGERTTPATMA